MKRKRLFAAAMAATLIVSASPVNTGMSSVYAEDESETAEEVMTDAEEEREEAEKEASELTEQNEAETSKEEEPEKAPEETNEAEEAPAEGTEETEEAPTEEANENTEGTEEVPEEFSVTVTEIDKPEGLPDLIEASNDKPSSALTIKEDEMVRVIIVMDGDAVLDSDPKAEMTSGNKKRAGSLEANQDAVVKKIEKEVLNEKLDISYHYTWLANAVAAEVPFGMIDEIEKVSGVKEVVVQSVFETEKTNPRTVADGAMIGREVTWASGYTGKGIKIAIVDTGLDTDHQSFAALPEDALTADSETKDKISSVLSATNAFERSGGLKADAVYHNTKVAYGFNYCDDNTDITHDNDTQGDHGTHVAGIAAANDRHDGEALGVAPDAQLYVMKVFGKNGGAFTEDFVAALEDALILGADVVNMSIGAPAGFSSDGEWIDEVFSKVTETNTILTISAANAYTSGYMNTWGTNTNLTSNPDNGTLGSPGSYMNATTVASVNNVGIKRECLTVDGRKFAFTEGTVNNQPAGNDPISSLAGQELEYVPVGNLGKTLEDFQNAGVDGKVALVQRGETPFAEKIKHAEDAGAVACIIYNNQAGTIGMDLTGCEAKIPAAAITQSDGQFMIDAKAENPELKVLFPTKAEIVPTEDGYRMSEFSSWGTAPNLSLEPDITAPGGNIYSTRDDGTYGVMSGTSQAAPNLAGISALVMQYAKKNYPNMSADEMHDFVNALLLSTAEPLMYNEELAYSPRNQGAGLANAFKAVNTKAYLSVDNNDLPKVELKDDPNKSGNYSYTFHVNNFGDKAQYYDVDTSVETENVLDVDGNKFMAVAPKALDAVTTETTDSFIFTYDYNEDKASDSYDARTLYMKVLQEEAGKTDEFFRYNLDQDEDADKDDVQAYLDALVDKKSDVNLKDQVLKVEAGKTADLNVNVAVSADGKAYMDNNFENGIYVEGYTVLTAKNKEGIDLSIPYMGFYGDWTKAPIFDCGFDWNDEPASQFPNHFWANNGDAGYFLLGQNPYISTAPFDMDNIALSPSNPTNGKLIDYIRQIEFGVMRNAENLNITYEDAVTGEVYFKAEFENVRKSLYRPDLNRINPFVYLPTYDMSNDGTYLENNTKVNLKVDATLDYSERESNGPHDEFIIPITIDDEAPVLTVNPNVLTDENGARLLEMKFRDNYRVAAVLIWNPNAGGWDRYEVPKDAGSEEITQLYDLSRYDGAQKLTVVLCDYAMNEAWYDVTVGSGN